MSNSHVAHDKCVGRALENVSLKNEGLSAGTFFAIHFGMDESSLKRRVAELERAEIRKALQETAGVKARAARALGITERMLNYRLKKYGLEIIRTVEGAAERR